ncbi:phenazine biosynthesis FMN-dependent oxidase PhzG [Chromobacterium sp. IIBBL 290-4]|uniref:phenazine biosynthesis FMN-dependent oxidase PhzG n=1 Tax=Chromobacterium sp. IIBBL 290-4 TaxID=2953890 RepID=UPI0020B7B159|nr:phenazine biosynthesis FMN-dependent oxidase PhzG [Chromobacterium sp. IIBBL 290-4]UTH76294.1 phenazine biosynthesis FMN-dependent oxidase PhzG [Chromobacterium sp. IIBBL 290-4]
MKTSRFETLTGRVDIPFPEYDAPPPNPMTLMRRWLDHAQTLPVREPKAMALATAGKDGRTSTRIIAFNSIDERGLVFCTHASSRKGREISETGWVSGILYWRETGQQIMISGRAVLLDEQEADTLWFARPVPMHAMSTASSQSDVLLDRAALLGEADALFATGKALPRPSRFVAYRIEPQEMEFWSPSPDRLHHRLKYDLDGSIWKTSHLQP